jgi:regulator of replication initiation timing
VTDLAKENETLRLENEYLLKLLADCTAQMQASSDYWRNNYLALEKIQKSAQSVQGP